MNLFNCITCKQDKTLDQFYKKTRNKNGLDYKCIDCWKAYKKQFCQKHSKKFTEKTISFRKELQDYVDSIKMNGCVKCGYKKCLKALVFHHVRPNTKSSSISNLVTRCAKKDIIKQEIDKCILLCQNCHHELHDANGDLGQNKRYRKNS